MRKYSKHLLALAIAIILVSCQYKDVYKTYTYSNDWEISYPSFFNKTTYVYPGAEFQVKNGYRDTYMFVRGFDTPQTSEYILDSLTTLLRSNLIDPRIEKDTVVELNGTTFTSQYITGILNDKRMFYIISVIQYENEFYHFGSWMFNTKRELWQEDFEKSLYSWKRLK